VFSLSLSYLNQIDFEISLESSYDHLCLIMWNLSFHSELPATEEDQV